MSILTTLTRMWLTRSLRPFTFTNEYDEHLRFEDAPNLGLYVHVPFCKSICNFCPYCKERYDADRADRYVDALLKEIGLVTADMRERRTVTSLYFGGGTPALIAPRLGEIIGALREKFDIREGIGAELHPDNVTPALLQQLKGAGVTKLSIGIQSFSSKFAKTLGRAPADPALLRQALDAVPFETVSMDFIFALPEQTAQDIQADIDTAFAAGANHVAVYPFIDFSFTDSPVPAMKKKQKRALLAQITEYCRQSGLTRDSIWTFSKEKDARYSSMTRDNFLGFGSSATTLLPDQFKINTFSVDEYCRRIDEGRLPTALTTRFTLRQRMIYYLFWAAYGMRVEADAFERFFGKRLGAYYGAELWLAKRLGWITEEAGGYTLTAKGAFYFHHYENFYTLAYIDKMWSLMRHTPFPDNLKL